MSSNQKNDSAATAAVPESGCTAAAQERVQELRRWREQIPRSTLPAAADATARLSSAASVPAGFIELTNIS